MLHSILSAMQNPDRIAFSIGDLTVYWYGILMALGIIVAVLLANVEAKRKKLSNDTAVDLCLATIPLGIIGARLYYVLFNFSQYASNPISILYIWEGGLAIYGAVLGGVVGIAIYSSVKKIRLLKLFDICAPGLVLAQAIGRWGNFFNQEAYGPLVLNPAHQWFPLAVLIDATSEIHYATFFYESMWCLITFLILWFILRKRVKHDGDIFLSYVLFYSFERMFVEGLRTDSLYIGATGIRVSQLLSAVLFLCVAAFFIIRTIRERQLQCLIWPKTETDNLSEEEGKFGPNGDAGDNRIDALTDLTADTDNVTIPNKPTEGTQKSITENDEENTEAK